MNKPVHHDDHELISCEICLKSIPQQGSKSVETTDYVAYFCGLDCYDVWLRQNKDKTDSLDSKEK